MSTLQMTELDLSSIMLQAYEIGDLMNRSKEVQEYIFWKSQIEADDEIQQAIRIFEKYKEKFADCERFGHYHPDYHQALEETRKYEQELSRFPAVKHFKAAEEALDDLLFTVSETIAKAVSEEIKVPSNKLLPDTGGCGSGGSCSGKCS